MVRSIQDTQGQVVVAGREINWQLEVNHLGQGSVKINVPTRKSLKPKKKKIKLCLVSSERQKLIQCTLENIPPK